MPKKNNYIVYELKQLEKYWKQLNKYMNDNPPDEAQDRLEYIDLPRGGQTVKVIAKKEDQIKLFKETLKELPKILSELNDLRKQVDTGIEKGTVRGDVDKPGFMDDEDESADGWKWVTDNEEVEFEEIKKDKSKPKKQLPSSNSYKAEETDDYEPLDEEQEDPDL